MNSRTKPTVGQCKVGAVFYSAISYFDDNGKGHVSIDEWVVRTIQHAKLSPLAKRLGDVAPMMVYLIRKTEFTWVRKTKGRDKTMCWAAKINSCDRQSFVLGAVLPRGLFTTRKQALQSHKEHLESLVLRSDLETNNKENSDTERAGWADENKEDLRLLAMVKNQLTRLKNKK